MATHRGEGVRRHPPLATLLHDGVDTLPTVRLRAEPPTIYGAKYGAAAHAREQRPEPEGLDRSTDQQHALVFIMRGRLRPTEADRNAGQGRIVHVAGAPLHIGPVLDVIESQPSNLRTPSAAGNERDEEQGAIPKVDQRVGPAR